MPSGGLYATDPTSYGNQKQPLIKRCFRFVDSWFFPTEKNPIQESVVQFQLACTTIAPIFFKDLFYDKTNLAGGSNMFYFCTYLGKWSNLTNMFEMGWNHQLEIYKVLIYT